MPISSVIQGITDFAKKHQVVIDSLKFLILGSFFDLSRRFSKALYQAAIDCCTVTATLPEGDPAYEWVRYYLLRNSPPITYHTSFLRDLSETLLPRGLAPPRKLLFVSRKPWSTAQEPVRSLWWGPNITSKELTKRTLYSVPDYKSHSQSFRYRGYTLSYRHRDQDFDALVISAFGRSRMLLSQFVLDAQRAYEANANGTLEVYEPRGSDSHENEGWKVSLSRPRRPLRTVILPSGVKESVLSDVKEFIAEKQFYRDRGLPYRRGWLLYGNPGTGKTSLISAIASELGLNIYLLNLGDSTLDDARVQELFRAVPEDCILVIEDIDCTTSGTAKRIVPEETEQESAKGASDSDDSVGMFNPASSARAPVKSKKNNKSRKAPKGIVTLSGLLNALDGLASTEGRLLFCTTNHIERIDPALIRAGRCDVRAVELFKYFYEPLEHVETAQHVNDNIVEAASSSKVPGPVEQSANEQEDTALVPKKEEPEDHHIAELAEAFGERLPEGVVSISAVQGFLMRFKRNPEDAVKSVEEWVESGYSQDPVSGSVLDQRHVSA